MKHTLALNPMVGLRGRDFVDAAQTVFKAAIDQPQIAVKQWFSFMGDLGKIVAGESARAAAAGRQTLQRSRLENQRPAPRAASELPGLGRGDPCLRRQGRPRRSGPRARQADLGHPRRCAVADERFGFESRRIEEADRYGGRKPLDGAEKLLEDLVRNGGMPSQVDSKPFQLGKKSRRRPGRWCFAPRSSSSFSTSR